MASKVKSQLSKLITQSSDILDRMGANVFVADMDLEIVYVNDIGMETLRVNAAKLEKALGIRVDQIVGENVTRFDQGLSHLQQALNRPSSLPYETDFKFDTLTIRARFNSINDSSRASLGYVITWDDISEQEQLLEQFVDYAGQVEAVGKSQAVIEFEMDGTIIRANDRFLETMGYSLEEIVGQHHRIFVDEATQQSAEYRNFWEKLNRGEYASGEYKRVGKGGKEIWLQSSYNAILDLNDRPFKVVKYAADVTKQKFLSADFSGQIEAIGKSQAVIEFELDGTIIRANDRFLETMGYSLEEIVGQHH
ncbi:MAG: methyl-accepting chemotaxis protein, partial [Candidatus Latescibacterota bacterium]